MSEATDGQRALVARLRDVLGVDARIESTWLSGSFGAGAGDPWSDIDVIAVVDADDRAACLAEYAGPRNPMGETVWLTALFGRIVSAVTPDWERYDIVFVAPQEFRAYDKAALRPLAAESLDAPPGPAARRSLYQPSVDGLHAAAEEFIRVLGLLPIALGREEHLAAQEGVGLLRKALIEMMFEANGIGRTQRGGAKRLNPYLTPRQRAAVEAVPQPGANRDQLIAANLALARLYLPLAKATLAKAGAPWPEAFEAATRRHLQRTLGLAI